MFRYATCLVIVTFLLAGAVLRADQGAAAPKRGFKPVWTAVGAGAGFGLGVWVGLTKFDDAIDSDRKVWTTAIVSAAIGGVLGFLVDRRQARANPALITQPATLAPTLSWQRAVYGSATARPSLHVPSVAELTWADGAGVKKQMTNH